MQCFFRLFFLMACLLLQSVVLKAQEKRPIPSTIKGVVTDAKGSPLAYANVYLEESMEGAMSDGQGRFSFVSRAVGQTTLVCSYIGYEAFRKTVTLSAGDVMSLNISLCQKRIEGRTVSVTASAFTAADEEGVTLTAMDVVRTPGAAADVFWAVKTFPGVQQVEEGAGLFVRGGDVSETAVYLDGAMLNHPYKYESPTGGFFGTISPFLLKGTFFSSGGFSAQYGNALSGALSMESHDLPDRRQVGVGIGLAAESVYLAVPIARDRLGFSLSGNRSNTKMLFELNKTRKEFSEYPFSYDFNLNAVYKIDPQQSLKFFLFSAEDRIGVEIDDPDYSTHFYGGTSNRLVNLKYKGLFGKSFLVQANMAFNRFRRTTRLGVMDLDVEDGLTQGRVTGEMTLTPRFMFRTGVEYLMYQKVIGGTVPQEELDLNPGAQMERVNTDYLSHRTAQFVEFDILTPLGVRVTPGLRGEYESISDAYGIDPRFSCHIPLTAHSGFIAAWGHYRQFPEPRYYDPVVGNPHLNSMRATHYILGYAYQRENRIFRIEGYYKKYCDLLLEEEGLRYTNEGHGYARGIDTFFKDKYGRWTGWIAYSWLQARRRWMDLPVLASPYFDITHNVIAVLNVDLPMRFSVGFSCRYATGRPYTPGPERYHEARVPDYLKVDIQMTYLHSFFDSNTTVFYIAVSNVLGRINIFDYRYSSDWQRRDAVESSFGRTVYFGFSFNM